ncbi:MAG TPA: hypothetical protein VGI10_06635 [Polyangiaceae bacterium]|jgi:hypothetical protein
MSIDGIGKPPPVPPADPSSAAGVQGRKTESFAIGEPVAPTASSSVSAGLEALRRGELSLDQYLSQRVDLAVGHLTSKLAPAELDFVKQSLRDQLETDPVLVELVQRTTAGLSVKSG